MQPLPEAARNAAIAQLVTGFVNIFVMTWLAWVGWGALASVSAFLTAFLGGCGGLVGCCGWSACLFLPLGIIEILAGIMALNNNPTALGLSKVVAYLEIASILLGGIVSFIVGMVAIIMLNKPEVEAWKAAQVNGPVA